MQKWEYLFVGADWANHTWRIKYVNGKEVANWKNSTTLFDYSNKLGNEGWELVSAPYLLDATLRNTFGAYELNTSILVSLIFKRLKS